MDRVLILIAILAFLFVLIFRNKCLLTKSKLMEIIISVYVFSCCFSRFGLPLYTYSYPQIYGPFGNVIRLEVFQMLMIVFIWIIAKEQGWRFKKLKVRTLLIVIAYLFYCFLNPFDTAKGATLVAINYLLMYLTFVYLLISCCNIKTIIRGIYAGFAITVLFHFVLAICFPILNMEFVVKLFNSSAVVRREGSPGTFGHPNVLGTYASYYMMFFVSCIMAKYRVKKSYLYASLSFVVIFLSGSRSALLAVAFGILVLMIFYIFRSYKIINPKILLFGVLPTILVVGLLFYFTPIVNLFKNNDMDEMALARMMHYYCAYEIISDHPLVGVGLNAHLKYLLANTSAIDFEEIADAMTIWMPEEFMFTNPIHNIWLMLLAELGIIGFIPIVLFISYYFYTFKKRIFMSKSNYYNIALMTGLGILSCLLVHGNSDWASLTPSALNISLLFICIGSNSTYAKEMINDVGLEQHCKL